MMLLQKDLLSLREPSHKGSTTTHIYYLQITDGSMETSKGISFPINSLICVNTAREPKYQDFVIAQASSATEVMFRQLILIDQQAFLHPLNPNYPDTPIEEDGIIYGVVSQLIKLF
jgi:SOS-response transcriptional repressor LexA